MESFSFFFYEVNGQIETNKSYTQITTGRMGRGAGGSGGEAGRGGGGDMHQVKRRSELAASATQDADNKHKAPNDGNRLNWQI